MSSRHSVWGHGWLSIYGRSLNVRLAFSVLRRRNRHSLMLLGQRTAEKCLVKLRGFCWHGKLYLMPPALDLHSHHDRLFRASVVERCQQAMEGMERGSGLSQ
jgi:hypothetical protein